MTAAFILPCDYDAALLTPDEWAFLRELAYAIALKAAKAHIEDEAKRRERREGVTHHGEG